MLFDLSGKTALVAGGAGYLGEAICLELARHGAKVMIADIALKQAEKLVSRIQAEGGEAAPVELDITREKSISHAVKETVARFGGLHILVNGTFGAAGKGLNEIGMEDFDHANRLNLSGGFILAREAADNMPEGGSLIFFTSMYGQVAPDPRVYHAPMTPNPLEYGVGKAGVIQMAKYLAVAWAKRGIRVNAISPGPFPNPGIQQDSPDFVERLAGKVPMGRIGRQNEIAGPVVFLASDASTFVNGETLNVDGGWTAW